MGALAYSLPRTEHATPHLLPQLDPYVFCVEASSNPGVRRPFDNRASVGEQCNIITIYLQAQEEAVICHLTKRHQPLCHLLQI